MIILKVLNVWIMMGLLSYVFVCLFTIISLWLMEWHDCNEEIEKNDSICKNCTKLIDWSDSDDGR